MKCKILHEARGHMRVHLVCGRMTLKEADILEYYLRAVDGVKEVKVYDRTGRHYRLSKRPHIPYSCARDILVRKSRKHGACAGSHRPRIEPRV